MILASNDFAYRDTEEGIEVAWLRVEPPVISAVRADVGERLEPHVILAACKGGRDVEHISRVTGYFSITAHWNPGKVAELRDRSRVKVEGTA